MNELTQLTDFVKGFADMQMRDKNAIRPAMYFLSPNGLILLPFIGDFSPANRQKFSDNARIAATALNASMVAAAYECWVCVGTDEGEIIPSEHPDRKEAVIVLGESRTAREDHIYEIQRGPGNRYFGLNPTMTSRVDRADGRFTNIIPKTEPPEYLRKICQQAMELMGVKIKEFHK